MPTFTLNVEFNSADLAAIKAANEQVVILKTAQITNNDVVWVAFAPFAENTVSWEDDYAVYASNQSLEQGAVVQLSATQKAKPELIYPFTAGAFGAPKKAPSIGPSTYEISNQDFDTPSLIFGLAQAAQVNGTVTKYSPLNAEVVLRGQQARFTPFDSISVLLMSKAEPGFVISEVFGTPIVLQFGGSQNAITIAYDGKKGVFVIR